MFHDTLQTPRIESYVGGLCVHICVHMCVEWVWRMVPIYSRMCFNAFLSFFIFL